MDIEFTVNLVVQNAIDQESLSECYNNDPLLFIKFLVQEEGLQGCTEDEFTITAARIVNASPD